MPCRGQEVSLQVSSAETSRALGLHWCPLVFPLHFHSVSSRKQRNGSRAVEHHIAHSMYLPVPERVGKKWRLFGFKEHREVAL